MLPCPNMHEYNYICTHVDDFKIVADSPEIYLNDISKVLFVKSHGSWSYYLGNNFTYHDTHDIWTYSCKTYKTEAIQTIRRHFWYSSLKENSFAIFWLSSRIRYIRNLWSKRAQKMLGSSWYDPTELYYWKVWTWPIRLFTQSLWFLPLQIQYWDDQRSFVLFEAKWFIS